MTKVPAIAVIGHTNTGKTSLMRTLTRQRDFGEISAHPATTRHVELAELAVAGRTVLHLYDTPGFEDSSGLLAHIERLKVKRGEDWIETIEAFAREPDLQAGFGQEAKAVNQILASDLLLYVVDVRDPVRAKHRDELELIGRCARPVVAVLNFLAPGATHEAAWRDQLARVNMHAVVAFDTVVYREADELALYAKIATLADRFAPALEALMAELTAARKALKRAAALIVAELIVDVAAARRLYPAGDEAAEAAVAAALKDAVRRRERDAVSALLRVHRFAERDYAAEDLPFAHGEWQEDLFDPAVLERFAINTAKALATGATAGLAIDLMTGGLTLGAAALAGATVGFIVDGIRRYGGDLISSVRGFADMRVAEPTLMHLIARNASLAAALLGRGHGAQTPIREAPLEPAGIAARFGPLIKQARGNPRWSTLSDGVAGAPAAAERDALTQRIAEIAEAITVEQFEALRASTAGRGQLTPPSEKP